jgi:hypothetical protein
MQQDYPEDYAEDYAQSYAQASNQKLHVQRRDSQQQRRRGANYPRYIPFVQ